MSKVADESKTATEAEKLARIEATAKELATCGGEAVASRTTRIHTMLQSIGLDTSHREVSVVGGALVSMSPNAPRWLRDVIADAVSSESAKGSGF